MRLDRTRGADKLNACGDESETVQLRIQIETKRAGTSAVCSTLNGLERPKEEIKSGTIEDRSAWRGRLERENAAGKTPPTIERTGDPVADVRKDR